MSSIQTFLNDFERFWRTQYQVEKKQKALDQVAHEGTTSSSGTLDESLVRADRLRKMQTKLSSSFYGNMKLHQAVESAPFVVNLRENPGSPAVKTAYKQYLVDLHAILSALETRIDTELADAIDLKEFYRADRLAADSRDFPGPMPERANVSKEQIAHFEQLAPKLLVAHAAMRYFAILHGGQQRAERLKGVWGADAPMSLYAFGKTPSELIELLKRKLDALGETLDPEERQDFEAEIITAWIFTGQLLGVEVSTS